MQPEIRESKPRIGSAIAALTLGLISLLDLGWTVFEYKMASPCGREIISHFFSISSILTLLLGIFGINRLPPNLSLSLDHDNQHAGLYGGKWVAILGVIISVPAALLTIANLPACNFQESIRLGSETVAIKTLQTIHQNQARYFAIKDRFGTLQELFEAGLIHEVYAKGQPVSGYIYTSSDVSAETYCVQARRANAKCGYKDFIICEDGIIHYVQSSSLSANGIRRGEGTPLSGANSEAPSPSPIQLP
jgi:hypothetical protein